jgi:hypothetical protein
MNDKLELPHFNSEAEEAEWWFANREANGERFAKAIREGRASINTLAQRVADSLTIQLDPGDAEKARRIAESRGMEYKSFVKNLVHEALAELSASR